MLDFKKFDEELPGGTVGEELGDFSFDDEAQPGDDMVSLAEAYGKEKRSIKSAEAGIEKRKEALAEQEAALFAIMENAPLSSFSTNGYTYFRRVDTYASVDPGNVDAAFEWLKGEDLGYLIKETVNSRSLSSEVKRFIEATGEIPGDDEGIKLRTVDRVGVRKK